MYTHWKHNYIFEIENTEILPAGNILSITILLCKIVYSVYDIYVIWTIHCKKQLLASHPIAKGGTLCLFGRYYYLFPYGTFTWGDFAKKNDFLILVNL